MTTPSNLDVPMATAARTKSSSPTAGPVRREGSVEPFEPYGGRPKKSAPRSLTSKEAPALQDPEASSGATARGLNPIPEGSTAPAHSSGAGSHGTQLHAPEVSSGATARDLKSFPEGSTAPAHSSGAGSHGTQLHAPPTYATIVQTSQANEVPLQIPTSTQAVPAGSNPFQGQTHTSEPEDRNQSQRTEEGSILHAFVCRGENAVGDILDRVIESFDNIAMAAPSWDPSGAFFAELPVGRREFARNRIVGLLQMVTDHFEAYFRKWDPASPSLLIASTQAHRHIEASTFIRGTVSEMASSVSQIRSDMAKLRSERRLRFQQEHMEVDDEALPSYARPTKASAAKGPGPKAKKTLDSIYEGGAASEAEEIMTPGARRSYADATKKKGKDKAPAKSPFEGMHPSVALTHRQRQAAAAKKAAASASTSTTAPPVVAGETSLGKRPRADSTHTTERPDTPSTAAPPAKKLRTADDWFKSLSVEMINNFALGLRVLGPTAVDFSIDQILATGQRMGSFGFPIEVSSQSVPPLLLLRRTPLQMLRQDRVRVPRQHETKEKGKSSFQAPTLRGEVDEKRRNQLQLAFQVRPELNFVNWLEDVWTKMTAEISLVIPVLLIPSCPLGTYVHVNGELVIQLAQARIYDSGYLRGNVEEQS
ncbi:hypothetical protein BC835DRAFT_1413298 [Cytidiella melzeri]|nr:hypothetical protein BC835DRAFT_1413298 [Cytidiella melzeri]